MEENLSTMERNYASTRRRAHSIDAENDALIQELTAGIPPAPEPSPMGTVQNEVKDVAQGASSFASGLSEKASQVASFGQQVKGGVGDVVNEATKGLYDVANEAERWLIKSGYTKENFIDDTPDVTVGMDWAPPPTDGYEHVGRGVGKFAAQFAAFMGSSAAVAAVGAPTAVAGGIGLATGAAISALAFDPHEKRLADLAVQYSWLKNPLTEYLASDPEDSAAEGRFKNAIESIIGDVALAGVFAGIGKLYKGARAGKSAAKGLPDATQVAAKEVVDDATDKAAKAVLGKTDIPEAGARAAVNTGEQAGAEAGAKSAAEAAANAPAEVDAAAEAALKSGGDSLELLYKDAKEGSTAARGLFLRKAKLTWAASKGVNLTEWPSDPKILDQIFSELKISGAVDNSAEAALKSGDATAPVDAAKAGTGKAPELGPDSMAAQGDSYKIISIDEAARAVGQEELSQVGRINLDMVDDNLDLRAVVANVLKENSELLEKTARGVVTDEQIKKGALAIIEEDPATLLAKKIGEGWAPEEARAAKILFESASEDVFQKSLLAASDTATDNDLQSFERSLLILNKWLAPRQAASAEAGRTLRQFGVDDKLTRVPLEKLFASKDLIEFSGGREQLRRNAKMLSSALQNVPATEKVKHFRWLAERSKLAPLANAIEEYRINAMLSRVVTQTKSLVGNIVTIGGLPLEKFGAATVAKLGYSKPAQRVEGGVLAKLLGKPLEEVTAQETAFINAYQNTPVSFQEAASTVPAFFSGLMDGWRVFKKGMKDGDAAFRMAGSKVMGLQRPRAISAEAFGLSGTLGRAFDLLGSAVNIPGRMLNAGDTAAKAVIYRMETQALAYRTALAMGTDADKMAKTVKDLVDFPPPHITLQASREGAERTFTNDPQILKKMYEGINENWAFRVAVPFAKVDLNIVDQTMQRLPVLSYLSPQFRNAMKAGGTPRDVAISKVALGTTMLLTGSGLAAMGVITGGGPKNRKAKKLLEETGWQPYSVKVGDTYISYEPLVGIGQIFRMASDMHQLVAYARSDEGELQSMDDLAISASLILADSATPDFLSDDFGKFITMISDETDPNKVRTYLQKQVTSFVPNILRDVKNVTDPAKRDISKEPTDDAWDSIIKPVRGMLGDDDLTVHRDLFGEEILYAPGTGPGVNSAIAFVNPFKVSKAKNDFVRDELVRLGVSGPLAHPEVVKNQDGERQDHLMVDYPPRSLSMSGGPDLPQVELKLSNEQYSRFVQLSAGIGLSSNLKVIGSLPPEKRPKNKIGTLREQLETLISSGYTEMHGMGKTRLTDVQLQKDQVKRVMVKKIVSKFRAVAAKQMLLEYPDLREKLLDAKVANAKAVGIEVDRDIVANALEDVNRALGVSSPEGMMSGEEQAPSEGGRGPRL